MLEGAIFTGTPEVDDHWSHFCCYFMSGGEIAHFHRCDGDTPTVPHRYLVEKEFLRHLQRGVRKLRVGQLLPGCKDGCMAIAGPRRCRHGKWVSRGDVVAAAVTPVAMSTAKVQRYHVDGSETIGRWKLEYIFLNDVSGVCRSSGVSKKNVRDPGPSSVLANVMMSNVTSLHHHHR
ncbi:hypothetical protein AAG570_013227 [Ranatra chinensis]|uniref:Uncharacterized protein n=1 Tax=Ranatra chinensis TaxID=642074 RepID=A0ABD0Z4F6_9HEMI